jgi:hypothetical protein
MGIRGVLACVVEGRGSLRALAVPLKPSYELKRQVPEPAIAGLLPRSGSTACEPSMKYERSFQPPKKTDKMAKTSTLNPSRNSANTMIVPMDGANARYWQTKTIPDAWPLRSGCQKAVTADEKPPACESSTNTAKLRQPPSTTTCL